MAAAATEIGLRLKEERGKKNSTYRTTFCQVFICWANVDRNFAPDNHFTSYFLSNSFVRAFCEWRENQTYPGTKSKSTALRAICVAAFCTSARRPRLEQNLD